MWYRAFVIMNFYEVDKVIITSRSQIPISQHETFNFLLSNIKYSSICCQMTMKLSREGLNNKMRSIGLSQAAGAQGHHGVALGKQEEPDY